MKCLNQTLQRTLLLCCSVHNRSIAKETRHFFGLLCKFICMRAGYCPRVVEKGFPGPDFAETKIAKTHLHPCPVHIQSWPHSLATPFLVRIFSSSRLVRVFILWKSLSRLYLLMIYLSWQEKDEDWHHWRTRRRKINTRDEERREKSKKRRLVRWCSVRKHGKNKTKRTSGLVHTSTAFCTGVCKRGREVCACVRGMYCLPLSWTTSRAARCCIIMSGAYLIFFCSYLSMYISYPGQTWVTH